MRTGTVKWFHATKVDGFIAPEDGSMNAFAHISAVERTARDAARRTAGESRAEGGPQRAVCRGGTLPRRPGADDHPWREAI